VSRRSGIVDSLWDLKATELGSVESPEFNNHCLLEAAS
jgi:hypothetical protein